jgi:hypothetical protein
LKIVFDAAMEKCQSNEITRSGDATVRAWDCGLGKVGEFDEAHRRWHREMVAGLMAAASRGGKTSGPILEVRQGPQDDPGVSKEIAEDVQIEDYSSSQLRHQSHTQILTMAMLEATALE